MKKSSVKKQGKIRVFVAMSGGVDSSVAAYLLKKQGYDVTGVFMKCFNIDGCAEKDAFDARRVAEHLKIPFYVFDFEKEYKKRVVKYMVDGYREGLTPNPDVMCNKEIKFGLFLEKALKLGADYVATGHYVRIREFESQKLKVKRIEEIKNFKLDKLYKLFTACDASKDQSYFLWTLTQNELQYCLFPVGDYLKSEVRAIAKKAGLPTAEKKDSQGICFLGDVSIRDFLKNYIKPKKGVIMTTDGKKIGEHNGVWFYTIGQRHGLNLKTKNQELRIKGKYETKPHYVVLKSVKTNTLVVAEGEDNPVLKQKEIELINLSFLRPVIHNSLFKIQVLVRVRYRQPLTEATLFLEKENLARLQFKTPQKFIASGQSAVFYTDSGEMLGGGVIL
ncbi:MAG: tRNA 2-thiouridine(34) synthase MnmA [Patescibacteria group bacterium]|nr:tRNA 2-thiouridine(34) synthase MnmA [Patescibacteria group bacterium]